VNYVRYMKILIQLGHSVFERYAHATDLCSKGADGRVVVAVDDARHDTAAEHRVVRLHNATTSGYTNGSPVRIVAATQIDPFYSPDGADVHCYVDLIRGS